MKSFHQFITEAYDKDLEGQASRKPGEEGRIRTARKKREIEKSHIVPAPDQRFASIPRERLKRI